MIEKLIREMGEHLAHTDRAPAPGRASLTARLMPKASHAVARHADAEAAVERAAASAGAPLPDDVRARFEGSLGADLSAVRVHTGPASAQAAAAVGARAYATGQDIHFAAGAYAPMDPFGLHLLAHEVAHTVQQQGGAPHRQHKLEDSQPGDAAEVEADRAADAVVAEPPAPSALDVSVVNDAAQARGVLAELDEHRARLARAEDTTGQEQPANDHARDVLGSYLVSLGEQSRTLGDFQVEYVRCREDLDRLRGLLAQQPQVAASAREMHDRVLAEQGGAFAVRQQAMIGSHAQLVELSRRVGERQHAVTDATHAFGRAVSDLEAGAIVRGDPSPDASAAMAKVKAQCQQLKSWIGMGLDAASGVAKEAMTGAGVPEAAAGKVTGALPALKDLIVDQVFAKQVAELQVQLDVAKSHQADFEYQARLDAVRAAKSHWFETIDALDSARAAFHAKKAEIEATSSAFAVAANAAGHPDVALIATLFDAADRLVAQLDATLGLGRAESVAAGYASEDAARVSVKGGLPYYVTRDTFKLAKRRFCPVPWRKTVVIQTYDQYGSAEGTHGVNPVVARSLAELTAQRAEAAAIRDQLGAALAFPDAGADGARTAGGPPAPGNLTGGH